MNEMDEILEEFAVEPVHDRQTLERYLRQWPQYATALIDLSREIARPIEADPAEMPATDIERLGQVFQRRRAVASEAAVDPFATMTIQQRADLPSLLRVPDMVVLAFRERRIILSTVPAAFLRAFAAAVGVTPKELLAGLALPRAAKLARSSQVYGQAEGRRASELRADPDRGAGV
ncbi:hypothetical protein RAA17_05325 [Komagataeibacter rhaeticus]|nr:hypothetical protein [Komagataeibacter rhaeticus]